MSNLAEIQSLIKAPKGQYNNYGKYKYRSCEDIMEAVKPVINPLGFWLIVTDEPVEIGGRVYIKATAILTNGNKETTYMVDGSAREADTKKGMDDAQVTGAASSYARKYALAGLFALDDTKDADATNNHADTTQKAQKPVEKVLKQAPQKPVLARGVQKQGVDMWQRAIEYYRKNGNFARIEDHYTIPHDTKEEIARIALEGE